MFNELLQKEMLGMYNHFQEVGVDPSMYMFDWIITIFSKTIPLDIAARIWDNFLFQGQSFIFRTALGLLKHLKAKIQGSSFEETLAVLHQPKIVSQALLPNSQNRRKTKLHYSRILHLFLSLNLSSKLSFLRTLYQLDVQNQQRCRLMSL